MTLAGADLDRDDIQFDSQLVKSMKQKKNTWIIKFMPVYYF